MLRPHVYERTAPRARPEATLQAARPVEVSRWISQSLPHMIDEARAAGLDRLADALGVARAEAETVVDRPGMMVEGRNENARTGVARRASRPRPHHPEGAARQGRGAPPSY